MSGCFLIDDFSIAQTIPATDMIWGVNTVNDCYKGIVEMIESTKNGYAAIGSRR